ncbi:MAG: 50S ribosomal protein L29 [Clostridia bacterium]|nr:50S ribosomal protein L29 [Clostridia bacterium]MBQ7075955.1 50S ribosomal protein L29 [Clostridia bacterium]
MPAKNNIKKLRDLTVDELTQKLKDSKAELFNLRFQQATNQLENPMRIVEVKKTIARVSTLIKEAEIANR